MGEENKGEQTKPATKKKSGGWKANLERVILVLGFGILLGSMFLGVGFRESIGSYVNIIVGPIFSGMPFYMVILILAVIVLVFSTIIQKYTMDWELQRRVMEKNKAYQKEYREAQLSGNKHKLKKLEEDRLTMLEDQASMSKQQMKPIAYLVFVSMPLFVWGWWYLEKNAPAIPPMIFPFLGMHNILTDSFIIFPFWIFWSILCSIAIGQVVRKALNVGVPT